MAKYIKQEVPDMKKTGEQKVFYRMKVERNIDFQEFIQQVCAPSFQRYGYGTFWYYAVDMVGECCRF